MEKLNKIFFRADGNTQIGLGHITRSLALADMLKDDFEIFVLIQNPTEAVRKQIQEVSNHIIELPPTEDYLQEAHDIAEHYLEANNIIVIDGYHFQTEYQKILKAKGVKLVCIDDLHAWHFVADVVINHAGGVKESDYSCEPYTQLCLGMEYALLRSPFLEAAKQDRKIEKIENVFICFGGSDSNNFTQKALKSCVESAIFKEIYVVVGSAYLHEDSLKFLAEQHKNIHVYQNLDAKKLCEVMQKCHLAIVPASSIALECLAVGMTIFLGYYIGNQKDIYKGMFAFDSIYEAGDFNKVNFDDIVSSVPKITYRPSHTFIGNSKQIKSIFIEQSIEIKESTKEHVDIYFQWANDPEVRNNSINQEPIVYENHCEWFLKKLEDNYTKFYIAYINKVPLGQLRIDIKEEKSYINYSVAKEFRKKGMGQLLVKKIINDVPNQNWYALVKTSNSQSSRIFENLNFIEYGIIAIHNQDYYIYTLDTRTDA